MPEKKPEIKMGPRSGKIQRVEPKGDPEGEYSKRAVPPHKIPASNMPQMRRKPGGSSYNHAQSTTAPKPRRT